jgi:hypothetical protein
MSAKHGGDGPSRLRDARIERARSVPIASIAPPGLKRCGKELVGPCPRCGGTDRFSIQPDDGVWSCRGCPRKANGKIAGGDPIDLIRMSGRAADLILDLHPAGRLSDLPILHDRSVRP